MKNNLKFSGVNRCDTCGSAKDCCSCNSSSNSEEVVQEFCDFLNMKNQVSRVEIIGPNGREIVTYGSYQFDIQDEGRTLKIFRAEAVNYKPRTLEQIHIK